MSLTLSAAGPACPLPGLPTTAFVLLLSRVEGAVVVEAKLRLERVRVNVAGLLIGSQNAQGVGRLFR